MPASDRVVNTIPSYDLFLRHVVDAVTAARNPKSAEELATSLRVIFPRVAVFERQLSGERPHLYVYRDGRYEPEEREAWWEKPDVPRINVSAVNGQLTKVTGSWASFMRAREEDLLGRHFLDFILPEAKPVAMAMFEVVAREREVRSEALVVRPDGSTVGIEFRAARLNGEIEVSYRPLDGASK